MTNMKPLYFNN